MRCHRRPQSRAAAIRLLGGCKLPGNQGSRAGAGESQAKALPPPTLRSRVTASRRPQEESCEVGADEPRRGAAAAPKPPCCCKLLGGLKRSRSCAASLQPPAQRLKEAPAKGSLLAIQPKEAAPAPSEPLAREAFPRRRRSAQPTDEEKISGNVLWGAGRAYKGSATCPA